MVLKDMEKEMEQEKEKKVWWIKRQGSQRKIGRNHLVWKRSKGIIMVFKYFL